MSADERLDPSFYRHWIEDRVRFADLDPLGHCNNAAIGGFFESSRVALFADAGYSAGGGGTPHRLASGFSEVWGSLAGKVWIEDGLGLEHGAGHADEAIGD